MKNLALLAALLLALAACGGSDEPRIGDPCTETCSDELACIDVGEEVEICTLDCTSSQVSCGDDAICVGVPSGVNACLARCDAGGGCDFGAPGYPFDPDECICIPWM